MEKKEIQVTNSKLFELLSLIQEIRYFHWDSIQNFRKYITENIDSITIIEKSWGDPYKNNHPQFWPLDITNIENWCTYDRCIDTIFENDGNKLKCNIIIHDINALKVKYRRWEASIYLPDDYIQNLKGMILDELDYHAEKEYEEYLEEQKRNWKEHFKLNILK